MAGRGEIGDGRTWMRQAGHRSCWHVADFVPGVGGVVRGSIHGCRCYATESPGLSGCRFDHDVLIVTGDTDGVKTRAGRAAHGHDRAMAGARNVVEIYAGDGTDRV